MLRSVFVHGALHGIEASALADMSLRKLRTAIFKVVWSRPSASCQYWCSI